MQLALLEVEASPVPQRTLRRRPPQAPQRQLGEREEAFLASLAWEPTKETYREDLAAFVEWCAVSGIEPRRATREQLDEWRHWMLFEQVDGRTSRSETQRVGLSGSVVRKRIGVVSRYFDYLGKRDGRSENPAKLIERPPAQDPDAPAPRWLSVTQTVAILDAAQTMGAIPHALACLLFTYGQPAVHVGELRGRDVFDRDGAPQIQLTVRKGRKLTQPLVGRTAQAIATLGDVAPADPLIRLPGDQARSAFRRRVMRLVGACARSAGVDGVNLIVVRHTWQALARLAEVPEDVIVRHSGIEWSARPQWLHAAEASVAVERLLATCG